MSNVIEFLERVGQDSQLRYATDEELGRACSAAGIETALKTVVLRADRQGLETLIGVRTNVCCIVFTSEENEDEGALPAPSPTSRAA